MLARVVDKLVREILDSRKILANQPVKFIFTIFKAGFTRRC